MDKVNEELDPNLLKVSSMICCPMCNEEHCVGKNNCSTLRSWIDRKRRAYEEEKEFLYHADPRCDHEIVSCPSGGVKCIKCNGWFAY